MGINHAKTSAKPDGGDATLVRPSDWNAAHVGTIDDAQIPATIARDAEVTAAIAAAIDALVTGAPGALDTLNELAAALGDDANFAATITALIASHTGDVSDAHDASAVSFTPSGSLSSSNVQAAIEEAASEAGAGSHPNLATHDTLGLATDAELVAHAATTHGAGTLSSYTVATLPAAGTAGRLARVTDNIRGVWMDDGTAWSSITGVANVKDFGAKGDSDEAGSTGTNDSAAIQAAIDAVEALAFGGTVFFPAGCYRVTSGVSVVSDHIRLLGVGKYASVLVGAGALVDTLTLASTSFHMEHFAMLDMGIMGSAAGRHAVAVAGTTLSQGLTQSSFYRCRIHTNATAYPVLFIPSRTDVNDFTIRDCSLASALSATSTAAAVVHMAGNGSINALSIENTRIHCNGSTTTKAVIIEGAAAAPNWWQAAISFRDVNIEQANAGGFLLKSLAAVVFDKVQNWDPVGAWTGSFIELASMGGTTKSQGVTIRNLFTGAYTAANRGAHYDIKLTDCLNVTIDTPSVSSLTELLRIDAGGCTGLTLLNVDADAVVDNLDRASSIWLDDEGHVVCGSVRLRHTGLSVPSGGESGEFRVGTGKLWLNDGGAWGYVETSAWDYTEFTKDSIPGLISWFNADSIAGNDGDAVATWPDDSDTNADAAQATSGNRPALKKAANGLNSHNVVLFDGTNDSLSFANPLLGLQSGTVFIVANRNNTSAYKVLLELKVLGGVNVWAYTSGVDAVDRIEQFYGDGTAVVQTYLTAPGNGYRVITGRVPDGAAGTLYIDGGLVAGSGTGATAADVIPQATAYIGAQAGTSRFHDRSIAEILIYDNALTTDEMNAVLAYLGAKYAITVGEL